MKKVFSERNIVVILFVMVLVSFSFAQNETKKIEQLYKGTSASLIKPSASKSEAVTKLPAVIQSPVIPE